MVASCWVTVTRRVAKDLPSLTHGGITMRATVAGICAGALLAGAV
jgi:hypothetical protein